MNKKRLFLLLAFLSISAGLITVLRFHEVNISLTEEDKQYIGKFLAERMVTALPGDKTNEEEIDFIIRVQEAVLEGAPDNIGIPFDTPREPKQLYLAKSGVCYDRSRVIEKVLRSSGFETRHISIFSTKKTDSGLKSLITPGVASHAVTEVLTSSGWLVVDSNHAWISVDVEGNPVSIERLRSLGTEHISWNTPVPSDIYEGPFIFVYGLYSRHGRFYPPYNALPDVNYRELSQNFL